MEIELTTDANKDLTYWKSTNNTKVLARIRELLESISETPFQGIGKPEALRYNLSGKCGARPCGQGVIIKKIELSTK